MYQKQRLWQTCLTDLLDADAVSLRVAHGAQVGAVAGRDLFRRAVLDEDRLAAPLHRHRVALGDVPKLELRRRERQHVLLAIGV